MKTTSLVFTTCTTRGLTDSPVPHAVDCTSRARYNQHDRVESTLSQIAARLVVPRLDNSTPRAINNTTAVSTYKSDLDTTQHHHNNDLLQNILSTTPKLSRCGYLIIAKEINKFF